MKILREFQRFRRISIFSETLRFIYGQLTYIDNFISCVMQKLYLSNHENWSLVTTLWGTCTFLLDLGCYKLLSSVAATTDNFQLRSPLASVEQVQTLMKLSFGTFLIKNYWVCIGTRLVTLERIIFSVACNLMKICKKFSKQSIYSTIVYQVFYFILFYQVF